MSAYFSRCVTGLWVALDHVVMALGALVRFRPQVLRVFGVPTVIDGSMWIFLAWMSLTCVFTGASLQSMALLAQLLGVAYFSVLFHEYAHVRVAQNLGYRAKQILLLPIGGAAQIMGPWMKHPQHEFWIAVAGPLSSLLLGFMFYPLAHLGEMFAFGVQINAMLVGFNMIPILPLDGGRIARAWAKSRWTEHESVTRACNWAGLAIAVVAAPFVWMYLAPVPAVILVGMAGFGFVERSAMRQAEERRHELLGLRQRVVDLQARYNDGTTNIIASEWLTDIDEMLGEVDV